ncbi:unnamed protein product [Mytilus edulis]|uniref:Uncharacterized protein n=1 Tax=Mytilus edulis TaxID=6550 RepID=A0A8S3PT91_MYTED|nr:unnamed protein product [Mytilus edulis]
MNEFKKEGKKGKKRKNDTKDQNISGEKPTKKQTNERKNSTHTTSKKVNKHIDTQSELTKTNNMTSFCNSPNTVQEKQPYPTYQQYVQPMQPMQPIPSPGFNQMSPMHGYYNMASQSPGNNMIPQGLPLSQSTMNIGQDTNDKIDSLAQKVDQMFQKLSTLDKIDEKLKKFESSINNLAKNVGTVNKRIDEIEKGMEFVNTSFEVSKTERENLKSTVDEIQINNGEIVTHLDDIRRNLNHLTERHLDLQTRSMRENLVFSGIPHKDEETIEETENIIKNFMYTELKMETTVDFHRAHRFGKETEFRDKKDGRLIKTRPIVCRFKNFKDREIVRSSAKELKGTHYGIQEQFPKEINDKRKMLWPYFKQAREDKKKAYLKRDKLFIDGNEFILPDDDEMETNDGKKNDETQGDFNSRTASLQDFNDLVDTDDFLAQNLIDINEFSNVDILDKLGIQRKRHSTDLNVNTYGRKLIQFCKNNNMYIMNGRIGNDEVGKPTSKNTSVVDYAISTADVLYLVENFDVLPFSSLYSDIHCPLELVLNCSNTKQSNVNINVESGENNTYIGKWNHDQVNEYKENLDKEGISQLLSYIMTKTENVQNVDKNTIDEIVNEIRDVLLNSARNTFGEFVQKTYGFDYTGGKQNHRDWFNTECRRERRAFRKSKGYINDMVHVYSRNV